MDAIKLHELTPFIRFAQPITYYAQDCALHASDARIFYVVKAQGNLVIGEESHALRGDTAVFIPPDVCYRFDCTGPIQLIAINFDYDWRRSEMEQVLPMARAGEPLRDASACRTIADCPALNAPIYLPGGQALQEEIRRIVDIRARQQRYYLEESAAQLKMLLVHLLRAAQLKDDRAGRVVREMLAYINAHYAQPIGAEHLAAQLNYSAYHLNRLMRRATGTTIHQYLVHYRITMAQRLLAETDEPIGQIARRVGFVHFAHFSSAFAACAGCTPSEYRARVCGAV